MEGRKRSGMLKKSVYNMRKRLVAFALAAAMVCTNVGADLNAAYAATSSSESVTFEMTGSQLVTAIEEAIENGNVISPGDLDFTNGDIAKFESLFYGEGKVLEVFPDPDGGSMDAHPAAFVGCVPGGVPLTPARAPARRHAFARRRCGAQAKPF